MAGRCPVYQKPKARKHDTQLRSRAGCKRMDAAVLTDCGTRGLMDDDGHWNDDALLCSASHQHRYATSFRER